MFNPAVLDRVRARLLAQKHALLQSVSGIEREAAKLAVSDDPELAESALRSAFAAGFQLEDREIRELEDIDRALAKVARREYGRCERCRRPIALERLEAAPAARYCLDCERAVEHAEAATIAAAEPRSNAADHPVPSDFVNLSAAEIVAIVREELFAHEGLRDVVVDWSADEVVLSGEASSPELAEIAAQLVADRLGLPVADRIRVTPALRELPGAAPGVGTTEIAEELSSRSEAPPDERPETGESGEPFTPPDEPTPEPRKS